MSQPFDTSLGWVVLLVLLCFGGYWFLRYAFLRKEYEEEAATIEALVKDVRDFSKKFQEGTDALIEASQLIESLKKDVAHWKGLAEVHIANNEKFESYARDAWDRYMRAGSMAGVAQGMMLRELEVAVRMLNEYRQKEGKACIEMDPRMREIYNEFKREHRDVSSPMEGKG